MLASTKNNMLLFTAAVAFPLMVAGDRVGAVDQDDLYPLPAVCNELGFAPQNKKFLAPWPANLLSGDLAYLLEGLEGLPAASSTNCTDYQPFLDSIVTENHRAGNLTFKCMGLEYTSGVGDLIKSDLVRVARVQVKDKSDSNMSKDGFEILVTVAPEEVKDIFTFLLDAVGQADHVFANVIVNGVAKLACNHYLPGSNSSQWDLVLGSAYGASIVKGMFNNTNMDYAHNPDQFANQTRSFYPALSPTTRTVLMNPVMSSMIRAEGSLQALVGLIIQHGEVNLVKLVPPLLKAAFDGLETLVRSSGIAGATATALLNGIDQKIVEWAAKEVRKITAKMDAGDELAEKYVEQFNDMIAQAEAEAAKEDEKCASLTSEDAQKKCAQHNLDKAMQAVQDQIDALNTQMQNDVEDGKLSEDAKKVLLEFLQTLWRYMTHSDQQDELMKEMYNTRTAGKKTAKKNITLDMIVRMEQDAPSTCTGVGNAINLEPLSLDIHGAGDSEADADEKRLKKAEKIFQDSQKISTIREYLYANHTDANGDAIFTLPNMQNMLYKYNVTEEYCPMNPITNSTLACEKSQLLPRTTSVSMWDLADSCCVVASMNAEYLLSAYMEKELDNACHDYRNDKCDIYTYHDDTRGCSNGQGGNITAWTSHTGHSWIDAPLNAFYALPVRAQCGVKYAKCWSMHEVDKMGHFKLGDHEFSIGHNINDDLVKACNGIETFATSKVKNVTNQMCQGTKTPIQEFNDLEKKIKAIFGQPNVQNIECILKQKLVAWLETELNIKIPGASSDDCDSK